MIDSKEKAKAHGEVSRLIRIGELKPASEWPCSKCGHFGEGRKHEWHHHKGYSEPHRADVVPLCVSCHKKEHPSSRKGIKNKPKTYCLLGPRYDGGLVKKYRVERNLTVAGLAQLSGVAASTIATLERRLVEPRVATVVKICDALGLEPRQMVIR